jgi:hypothetical protein
LSTAARVGTISGPVRVTHPFHPLRGKKIAAVYRRNNWGEDRVMYLERSRKRPRSIPATWTDIVPEDEFRRISQGRATFRASDLIELSAMIERLAPSLQRRPMAYRKDNFAV